MRKALAIGLSAFLSLAPNLFGQTTGSDLEKMILDYKQKVDSCIVEFSKKDATEQEKESAALETSFLLQRYKELISSQKKEDKEKTESDLDLAFKIVNLRIGYAEHQIASAYVTDKRPRISPIERAFKEYQLAHAGIARLGKDTKILEPAKRIQKGLADVALGFDNYAIAFENDVFQNPECNKLPNNKSAEAKWMINQIDDETKDLSLLLAYSNALENNFNEIKEANENKKASQALDSMILGIKLITPVLEKDKIVFREYFRKYNVIAAPAMEMVGKNQSEISDYSGKIAEWTRFYDPLITWVRQIDNQNSRQK